MLVSLGHVQHEEAELQQEGEGVELEQILEHKQQGCVFKLVLQF